MKESSYNFKFSVNYLRLNNKLNSCANLLIIMNCTRIVYMDGDCNFQTEKQADPSPSPEQLYLDRQSLLNNKSQSFAEISSSCVEDGHYHSICSQLKFQQENQALQASSINYKLLASAGLAAELRNPNTILKAGFLQRRSNSFFKTWNTRFCLVTFQKLLCFQDETRTYLISCLNLKRLKCSVLRSGESERMFCINCEDEKESFVFRAQVVQQCQAWIKEISIILNENKSHPKIKIRDVKKDVYLQKDSILECQLLEMAQTGDILLMKTEDTSCALQRLVTNSQYDHVSMIVKFSNKDVRIFEANADEGVQIYDWDHFHNRFNHFQKVCLRKLYHYHKQEIHPVLLGFIKRMIGSKYKMNALQLLRKFSDQELAQSPRNFFCSELVAKAYKQIGLLGPQKASNSYWPVDFTFRGGIVLQNGSSLGPQKLIVLKKHLKTVQ